MTKEEVYETLIQVHKETGQGMCGIINKDPSARNHILELIDEGLIVKFTLSYSSIGDPESSNFYLSSSGYNVWEDGRKAGYDIEYISNIRIYLGFTDENEKHLVQDLEFMKEYIVWLERNREQLEIMKKLSTVYKGTTTTLTSLEIAWIKPAKPNITIKEYLESLDSYIKNQNKIIELCVKILELQEDKQEIEITEKKIELAKQELVTVKRIISYLSNQDSNKIIQDLLKEL